MKILQVIPYFVPAWAYGGPVKVVYEMSKELVIKGHGVTVYTTDAYNKNLRFSGKTNEIIDVSGIKVCYFKNVSNYLAYNFNRYLPIGYRKAVRQNLKDFDIVHLHDYYTYQNVITAKYCRKYNIPYVLSAHGSILPSKERGRRILKKTFIHFFGHSILKDARRVIALTEIEKKQYIEAGVPRSKIRIIPNAVSLSEFRDLPKKGTFKQKYSIRSDEKIVLFVGRIHKIKGLDLLIKAFSSLVKDINNIKLVIVGPDGGDLSRVKRSIASKKIEEKVLITGLLSGREKLSAYVDADVFALSSYSEIFSMSILEACATGTPIVATDLGTLPEIAEYKAGLLVRCDENDLYEAILQFLKNDELARTTGKNGRRMVKDKFTLDKVIEQLEKCYVDVIRCRK